MAIADASTGNAVWASIIEKNFTDARKALRNLSQETDQLAEKGLKDFPPKKK